MRAATNERAAFGAKMAADNTRRADSARPRRWPPRRRPRGHGDRGRGKGDGVGGVGRGGLGREQGRARANYRLDDRPTAMCDDQRSTAAGGADGHRVSSATVLRRTLILYIFFPPEKRFSLKFIVYFSRKRSICFRYIYLYHYASHVTVYVINLVITSYFV